jgi:hypothetical protein
MGTTFGARVPSANIHQTTWRLDLPSSHISVVGTAVAGINDGVAGVDCLGIIVVTSQAMRCVAGSRSVNANLVGELLSCD